MTATLIEHTKVEAASCRYAWCTGTDHDSTPSLPNAEHNHWSETRDFKAVMWDERIGVQLYGYEWVETGADPIRVYLALGDDTGADVDGFSITPAEARTLGTLLRNFKPKDAQWQDEMVFALGEDSTSFTVEFRHERQVRHSCELPAVFEFSLRTTSTTHMVRMSLPRTTARFLGRHLVESADLADASDRADRVAA